MARACRTLGRREDSKCLHRQNTTSLIDDHNQTGTSSGQELPLCSNDLIWTSELTPCLYFSSSYLVKSTDLFRHKYRLLVPLSSIGLLDSNGGPELTLSEQLGSYLREQSQVEGLS